MPKASSGGMGGSSGKGSSNKGPRSASGSGSSGKGKTGRRVIGRGMTSLDSTQAALDARTGEVDQRTRKKP